jgi:predicted transcriptional regulator
MDNTQELKRLVNLTQIRAEMKKYKIKQSRIAKETGLTKCMISRYLSGVKPKEETNGDRILNIARILINTAQREAKK